MMNEMVTWSGRVTQGRELGTFPPSKYHPNGARDFVKGPVQVPRHHYVDDGLRTNKKTTLEQLSGRFSMKVND